ncbi:MAG: FtsQ-type POTRA domain-containing protein [Deltaproteobacteria bacterium]|nr:FtsQ-type POTRA domain-containing protein [Deltaproteobacteria bacterium]
MPRNSRNVRPSRLAVQKPVKIKNSGLFSRGKSGNSYRRTKGSGSQKSILRLILLGSGIAGLAGLCVGLLFLYHLLLTSSFFCIKDIRNIEIDGARRLKPEVILHLANLGPDTNLLAIQPGRVERALMAHPWIKRAELTRKWPHSIQLHIQEREPAALVQLGEDLFYIDRQGTLYKPLSPGDPQDFPVITGLKPENLQHPEGSLAPLVAQIFQLLDVLKQTQAPLGLENVSEVHLDLERGYTLYVNGLGAALDLGFNDYSEKLKKFAKVLPALAQKGYLARTGRINLDYPDRVLINLKGTDEAQ